MDSRSDRPRRDDREGRPSRSGDSRRSDSRPSRPSSGGSTRGEGRPDRGAARGERRDDRGAERGSYRGENRRDSEPGRGAGRSTGRPERGSRDSGRGFSGSRESDDRPQHKEWANTRRDVEVERKRSPLIPDEITEKDIEIGVRAQLKTLTPENAEKVARHLAMVNLLIDQDPELAHEHALAAADRAGRIAVVRETVGCTAYAIGDFALALRELLTHRRISGSNEQIALIVDSERGLERPERAIEVGRSVDRATLSPEARVNLAIAMSGARLDLGQLDLALSELEIPELNPAKVFAYSAPLFFAYADVLEDLGRATESKRWATLGNRAAAAFADDSDEETIAVLEEIEIPVRREWTPEERAEREARRERGGFDSRGGSRGGFDSRGGSRGSGSRDAARGGEREDRPRRPQRDDRGDTRGSSDAPRRPARSVNRDDYRPKREK